jgi:hypothetical protein
LVVMGPGSALAPDSARALPGACLSGTTIQIRFSNSRSATARSSLRASAKQSIVTQVRCMDCFVARAPRNDGADIRVPAARRARALPETFRPSRKRARGMPGAQCTRSLVCAGGSDYAHQYSQRRHRKHPAFPTQWFYGLYVISPATNSSCHRRLTD